MNNTGGQRLFVALWPDDDVVSRFLNLQEELELERYGRCTQPKNLHITLLFLGDVAAKEIELAKAHIQSVDFNPFGIEFDRVGFWPGKRIFWAGCESSPAELTELVTEIREKLPECANSLHQFKPHVTLSRKNRKRIRREMDPIPWHVTHCDLVRSYLKRDGPVYEVIASSRRGNSV